MAMPITGRLAAWLQQEAGGLGLREVRSDGREPTAHPAAVLRLLRSGGQYPIAEQEIELRIITAGARPAQLAEQLSGLTTSLQARLSRFCLEQPELRSIRWLETRYPRPRELPGGPLLASSISRLGMTLLADNAQEVPA